MPKQIIPPNITAFQEPTNDLDDALPSFALNNNCQSDSLLANAAAKAKATSVDLVEAYIKLLLSGKELVMLTVAKEAQSIWSIILLVDNHKEIECIADSLTDHFHVC